MDVFSLMPKPQFLLKALLCGGKKDTTYNAIVLRVIQFVRPEQKKQKV